jgi:hypothetical protein
MPGRGCQRGAAGGDVSVTPRPTDPVPRFAPGHPRGAGPGLAPALGIESVQIDTVRRGGGFESRQRPLRGLHASADRSPGAGISERILIPTWLLGPGLSTPGLADDVIPGMERGEGMVHAGEEEGWDARARGYRASFLLR